MTWQIKKHKKKIPVLDKPILIEGLPGIGNVGKIAVDFLIGELKAKKIYDYFSYALPHSVFINEDNLVDLPTITLYYKKFDDNRKDLLLLAGDVQPVNEEACYEFSDKILDNFQEFKGESLLTLGGIGLSSIPKIPKVFCTGNNKKIVEFYQNKGVHDELYGVVGPIIGVSGLLLGLAKRRNIPAASLLAETFGHPLYLGIKGAKGILCVLEKRFNLNLDLKELDKEIKDVETEMLKRNKEFGDIPKQFDKLKAKEPTSYIG